MLKFFLVHTKHVLLHCDLEVSVVSVLPVCAQKRESVKTDRSIILLEVCSTKDSAKVKANVLEVVNIKQCPSQTVLGALEKNAQPISKRTHLANGPLYAIA